jgi:8-oxo-dGTP pyrophosphatase MutT (NUDIX family)
MPDLFALLPALRQADHPLLAHRQIALIGVSAILHDDERYYFEVNRPRYWGQRRDGTLSVGIGGIGGQIEKGESALQCLRREVQEELGVEFRLEPAPRTALIHEWELAGWLDLPPSRKHPAPYLVNLLPPRLGGPEMPDALAIVTFMGRLRSRPQRGDLFGLLTVHRAALPDFFARDEWPLEAAQDQPALALELEDALPAGAVLRPVLTARAFGILVRRHLVEP